MKAYQRSVVIEMFKENEIEYVKNNLEYIKDQLENQVDFEKSTNWFPCKNFEVSIQTLKTLLKY